MPRLTPLRYHLTIVMTKMMKVISRSPGRSLPLLQMLSFLFLPEVAFGIRGSLCFFALYDFAVFTGDRSARGVRSLGRGGNDVHVLGQVPRISACNGLTTNSWTTKTADLPSFGLLRRPLLFVAPKSVNPPLFSLAAWPIQVTSPPHINASCCCCCSSSSSSSYSTGRSSTSRRRPS